MMLIEVGNYLKTAGVVGAEGESWWVGSEPDGHDEPVIILYQYPAGEAEYVQDVMLPNQERAQIQVVARGIKYDEVELLAYRAWRALSIVRNATLSGVRYRSIMPNSSPGNIGRDSHDRVKVGFNATVEKEVTNA